MQIQCWYCHKIVSSELPDDSNFWAIAVCPMCIEKSPESKNHPLLRATKPDAEADVEKCKRCGKPYSNPYFLVCPKCR